jgi:uncharacterized protein YggT (Ycf19 family)
MAIVDLILNVAGLLIWLNWRSIRFDPLIRRKPATLMGTLRPASPAKLRRWHFLLIIAALLLLRALIYCWIGSATGSTTSYLDLGATSQGFRHDIFPQALAFSFFSFARALAILYIWLLFFSILSGPEPIHSLVKIPLGRVDDWPRWVKVILPFLVTALSCWLASWIFAKLPPQIATTPAQKFQASVVIGLSSYLVWKFPACAILLLHLLSSYIYFGKHPLWNYISQIAQKLLLPLKPLPLRVARVDFAPVLAIAIVFLVSEFAERGLVWLYAHRIF